MQIAILKFDTLTQFLKGTFLTSRCNYTPKWTSVLIFKLCSQHAQTVFQSPPFGSVTIRMSPGCLSPSGMPHWEVQVSLPYLLSLQPNHRQILDRCKSKGQTGQVTCWQEMLTAMGVHLSLQQTFDQRRKRLICVFDSDVQFCVFVVTALYSEDQSKF